MDEFPLPGSAPAVVAAMAPGAGPGFWAGAPSSVQEPDGTFVIGYRVRHGHDGNDETVVARSPDGEKFTTIATVDQDMFGAQWMERPALIQLPDGRWRMYVCCGTPASKGWWIEMLEAADPSGFADAPSRIVFPGDASTAVKDPIIRLVDGVWHAWICCHLLDVSGAEDRMRTDYATSDDGVTWTWQGTVLGAGEPGSWDARGARLTTVLPDGRAAYDGRASAKENWFERTGLAVSADGKFTRTGDGPVADVRYLDVLPLAEGGYRIYYEARLPDESHELRTELIAP